MKMNILQGAFQSRNPFTVTKDAGDADTVVY